MYQVNDDMSIYVTRGDAVLLAVSALDDNGDEYTFKKDETLRFKVFEKKACADVVMQKDVIINSDCTSVEIYLTEQETRIGGIINKPRDYWYEVELNSLSIPQTIIGYDEDGAKLFRLFPEGGDYQGEEKTECN